MEESENPKVQGLPPLGRRERKKLDTRRKIFRAAFTLFTEKGFEETTVEEIAQKADVGKGTVFNYFPQKTAFLIAAYREWVGLVHDELGPVESWEGHPRDQLSRVFHYLTEKSLQSRSLARLVIFENMREAHLRMIQEEGRVESEAHGSLAGGGAVDDSEAVRLLEVMAREVIRNGKTRGEIRQDVDDVQAASLIAAAEFHTLFRGLVRKAPAQEIEDSMATKLDIIFTGLTP